MKKQVLFLIVLTVLSAPALAQQPNNPQPGDPNYPKPNIDFYTQGKGGIQPGFGGPDGRKGGGPKMSLGTAPTIDQITEPFFPEVKFLEPAPPASLTDRVDRILHGFRMPMEPPYDHYGYEIRRYMAQAASPKIMGDPKKIKEQLQKVEKAAIIARYWSTAFNEELDAIEKQIEAENAPAIIRSTYTYNSGLSRATLAEVQNWIEHNKKLLEFLDKRNGFYKIEYPNIIFDTYEDGRRFFALYEARDKALKHIKEYTPWAMMVY